MEFTKDAQVSGFKKIEKTVEPGTLKENNLFQQYIRKEAGNEVFEYFAEMGIFQQDNVLVLSSKHYYAYDNDSLKDLKVIFNLKLLNTMNHVDLFFYKLNSMLRLNAYYIGCFEDFKLIRQNPDLKKSGQYSYLGEFAYSFPQKVLPNIPLIENGWLALTSGRKKYLTLPDVASLMNQNGFNIVTLKTFGNRTYFLAKKIHGNRKRQKTQQVLLTKLNLFSTYENLVRT